MESPFKVWSTEKKIKDSDLIFTHALKTDLQKDVFSRAQDMMATFRPSFSEGLGLLELITDLILMGFAEEIFESATEFESWKAHLRKLRFPVTTGKDQELRTKLENLPWPSQAKIKFERRGDRAGVELKYFINSTADLTKLIAALERVKNEMSPA